MKELDKIIQQEWQNFDAVSRSRYRRGKLGEAAALNQLKKLGWKIYAKKIEA
jgi:hypothetical protein